MTPSFATHCVLCGAEAVLAPRVHLRDLQPGAPAHDVALGLCEVHGSRLRKGELRVVQVVEGWLAAEGRVNPNNPLDRLRLLPHCLACDAPLVLGGGGGRRLPGGELVAECPACPMSNVIESLAGEPVAARLFTPLSRPRPS
jgi:hypothetical protein